MYWLFTKFLRHFRRGITTGEMKFVRSLSWIIDQIYWQKYLRGYRRGRGSKSLDHAPPHFLKIGVGFWSSLAFSFIFKISAYFLIFKYGWLWLVWFHILVTPVEQTVLQVALQDIGQGPFRTGPKTGLIVLRAKRWCINRLLITGHKVFTATVRVWSGFCQKVAYLFILLLSWNT